MKLRNKKTGEIGYLRSINWNETALIIMDKNGVQLAKYNSLAELNAEWEDYEEPKDFYYIQPDGELHWVQCKVPIRQLIKFKEIGNYFDTREEAVQAVEKLKAWKRLKENGFRFDRWNNVSAGPYIPIYFYFEKETSLEDIKSDLDLLFGGEE